MTVKARKHETTEERVTPLELFFDLIFVFAITQVTGLIVADPTWAGSGAARAGAWRPGTSPSATP